MWWAVWNGEEESDKTDSHVTSNPAKHSCSPCSLFFSIYEMEVLALVILQHLRDSAPCARTKVNIFGTKTGTLFQASYFYRRFQTATVKAVQARNENKSNRIRKIQKILVSAVCNRYRITEEPKGKRLNLLLSRSNEKIQLTSLNFYVPISIKNN